MKTISILTICFLSSLPGFSQAWVDATFSNAKEDFKAMAEKMKKPNTTIEYTKEMYRNYFDDAPQTSSKGKIITGTGLEYRHESEGALTIQTQSFCMSIDSSSNQIFLLHCDSLMGKVDVGAFLDKSADDYTIRTYLSGEFTNYMIIPKQRTGGQTIELKINKSKELRQLTVYFPKGNYEREELGDQTEESPKVVMTYKTPRKNDPKTTQLFSVSNWITKGTDGKYVINESLSTSYSLHDLRYEPTK